GHIFNEATQQAVLFWKIDDHRRNLLKSELQARLQAALPADKIVCRFLAFIGQSNADLDWLFESEILDAFNDGLEFQLVPLARVQDANAVYWNHSNGVGIA